jgi:hypothetical protein
MFHQLISSVESVLCLVCGQAWDDSMSTAVEPQDFECSKSAARCMGDDMSDPDTEHAHYWDADGRDGVECVVCGINLDLGGE